jgi:hypothetical protein
MPVAGHHRKERDAWLAAETEILKMAWSLERKRFAAALLLYLLWVLVLSLLAIVSAYRPASRTALPEQPAATSELGAGGDEK